MSEYLLFIVEHRRFALSLAAVHRVVRMVAITPLPDAQPTVAGMVDLHGKIVPVLDLRCRCGLPQRPPRLSDHLLLATAGERTLALAIDAAEGVFTLPAEELTPLQRLLPGAGQTEGAATIGDDIVLIYDLERFVPLADLPGDRETTGDGDF
jgi:purine-binding chemotaxis protein CheW